VDSFRNQCANLHRPEHGRFDSTSVRRLLGFVPLSVVLHVEEPCTLNLWVTPELVTVMPWQDKGLAGLQGRHFEVWCCLASAGQEFREPLLLRRKRSCVCVCACLRLCLCVRVYVSVYETDFLIHVVLLIRNFIATVHRFSQTL